MKTRVRRVVKLEEESKLNQTVGWVTSWLQANPSEQMIIVTVMEKHARLLAKRLPDAVLAETFYTLKSSQKAIRAFNEDSKRVLVATFESLWSSPKVVNCPHVTFFDWRSDLRSVLELEEKVLPMIGNVYFLATSAEEYEKAVQAKDRLDKVTEMMSAILDGSKEQSYDDDQWKIICQGGRKWGERKQSK